MNTQVIAVINRCYQAYVAYGHTLHVGGIEAEEVLKLPQMTNTLCVLVCAVVFLLASLRVASKRGVSGFPFPCPPFFLFWRKNSQAALHCIILLLHVAA